MKEHSVNRKLQCSWIVFKLLFGSVHFGGWLRTNNSIAGIPRMDDKGAEQALAVAQFNQIPFVGFGLTIPLQEWLTQNRFESWGLAGGNLNSTVALDRSCLRGVGGIDPQPFFCFLFCFNHGRWAPRASFQGAAAHQVVLRLG